MLVGDTRGEPLDERDCVFVTVDDELTEKVGETESEREATLVADTDTVADPPPMPPTPTDADGDPDHATDADKDTVAEPLRDAVAHTVADVHTLGDADAAVDADGEIVDVPERLGETVDDDDAVVHDDAVGASCV